MRTVSTLIALIASLVTILVFITGWPSLAEFTLKFAAPRGGWAK
jgi:hypothetical protein